MTDLFTWAHTHSRRSDPSTSKIAASRSPGLAHDHWAKIVAYLQSIAPRGATYEEIAEGTNLDRHQVGRRLKEIDPSLIYSEGYELLSTNRLGRVWYAR